MASAAVDCRPLRDTNTGSPGSATLATLHPADAVSSPTAAAVACQRTPGSTKKVAVAYHCHPFGAEAVGRKLSIVPAANSTKGWEKATVLEYDAELGQHKVRYSSTKQEEWLFLSDLRFKWTQVLAPNAPVNPTFRPEYSKEAAVGRRVKVYWPGMQKWYHGTVKSYDPKTDKHMISYKDGDTQSLLLKHEPVLWCDDEPAANGSEQVTATTPRHSSSLPTSPRAVTSPRAAAGTSAASARAHGAIAATAAAMPAATVGLTATQAIAPPAAQPIAVPSRQSTAVRRKTVAALPTAVVSPKAPTRTGRPVGRPPGSTKARSPSANILSGPRGKSPGAAGPATTAAARSALASSFAGTAFGRVKAAAGAGKQGSVITALAGSNPAAVGSRCAAGAGFRPGVQAAAATAGRGLNLGQPGSASSKQPLSGPGVGGRLPGPTGAAAGLVAGRQQQGHRVTTLGKHGRDSSVGAADSASKRFKRGGLMRSGSIGASGRPAAIADKHLAVGCRVAVYWRLDKVFYRGKITSYSPQSGKYTIKYDDGQSEQVMLERERFVWHSPRGLSAGYRPALHSVMQQLGAEGLQLEPQIGVDGVVIPEVKGPEGAPHPPISGPGAVGWRIQLYWGADQDWHDAEVLSYDEARRKHHVLYLDGEEEWLELSKDNIIWIKATRHGAISAGIVTGDDVPKGRDALGWRIAVYWKDDRMFYEGEIIDFESSAGRHKVLYNDGEEEWLLLRNERVIWRLAPSEDSSADEDEDEQDADDEFDLQGSDEEVVVIDGELVTAGAGRGRGRRRKMRRLNDIDSQLRARSRGLDSDSASASSGQNGQGPFALAGGSVEDGLGNEGLNHLQQQHFGSSAAGYSLNGLQQSAAAGVGGEANLQLHLKRGPSGSLAARAGRGFGGLGSTALYNSKSLGGSFARPGAGGRGPGGIPAGAGGHLNLPPLQLRRASGSGECLGSPLCRSAPAEHIQLLVRIVPGGRSATSSADGGAAVTRAGLDGVAADTAAIQPVLQTLPLQQRRTAARLQRKMIRLQMILGKLATTAGTMGWKLEPQQLPGTSLLTPRAAAAAAAAAAQQQVPAAGPTSPRARAMRLKGPASPTAANAPMSPRLNGASHAASALTGSQAAADVTAAGSKMVAVHKTCAVKSKPGQLATSESGLARLKVKPSETPLHAASSTVALATTAGINAADIGTQALLLRHQDKATFMVSSVQQQLHQAQAAYAVSAGLPATMAVTSSLPLTGPITIAVPAAMLASPAMMQVQQRLQDPAALAAVAAAAAGASNAAALGKDIMQQPTAIKQALLAGLSSKAQGPPVTAAVAVAAHQTAPGSASKLCNQKPAAAAAGTSNKPAAAHNAPGTPKDPASVGPASSPTKTLPATRGTATPPVASPVKGRAPAPSYPGVSDPSAPSVQRSADDVVQMLQAMAAAQGNASPAVQHQLQHMAAAVAAANAAVRTPSKGRAASAVASSSAAATAVGDKEEGAGGESLQPVAMSE